MAWFLFRVIPNTATPNSDLRFSDWSGTAGIVDSQSPSTTVAVDSNKSVQANFIIDSTLGYNDFISVFGRETDIAVIGPDMDFDNDGKSNFLEYAFVLDPTSPINANDAVSWIHIENGQRFGRIAFKVRDNDSELIYRVQLSDDLSNWTQQDLTFSGTSWESSNSNEVKIISSLSHDDGTWTVEVEDQVPVASGSARFIRLEAIPRG